MYPNLMAEIARAKIKKKQISTLLNISPTSLYLKMKNGSFTMREGLTIHKVFFPEKDVRYLFTEEE